MKGLWYMAALQGCPEIAFALGGAVEVQRSPPVS